MNNSVYFAQMLEPVGGMYTYQFVGIFTTRKNAEDAVCDILAQRYNKTIHYTDYSAEADFLERHSDEYKVKKIEINKNYH